MPSVNWTTYAWEDETGAVRYVGCGPYGDSHPAVLKWNNRHNDDSPLHKWLQSLESEPKRVVCGSTLMPKNMARTLAKHYRNEYAATIFEARGLMSYNGGGSSRQVIHCPEDLDGLAVFPSVRKAAEAVDLHPAQITRRCQNESIEEWVFADEEA